MRLYTGCGTHTRACACAHTHVRARDDFGQPQNSGLKKGFFSPRGALAHCAPNVETARADGNRAPRSGWEFPAPVLPSEGIVSMQRDKAKTGRGRAGGSGGGAGGGSYGELTSLSIFSQFARTDAARDIISKTVTRGLTRNVNNFRMYSFARLEALIRAPVVMLRAAPSVPLSIGKTGGNMYPEPCGPREGEPMLSAGELGEFGGFRAKETGAI